MSLADDNYKRLVLDILKNGLMREDRTGTGTISVFGRQQKFDLRREFPIITTKKIHFKSVVGELLWFLRGDTNTKWLSENGITIWNEWADKNGDLGPVYGQQLRRWEALDKTVCYDVESTAVGPDSGLYLGEYDRLLENKSPQPRAVGYPARFVDQVAQLVDQIKANPFSRRHIITTWNPADLPKMALAPCHGLPTQFYVTNAKRLSCHVYIRSNDLGLGNPFNVPSYALLTHMIAQVTGLHGVDELTVTYGDAHVYQNHLEALKGQIKRKPFPAPQLWLNPDVKSIDDFTFDDIRLENYQHHPAIKMAVAV